MAFRLWEWYEICHGRKRYEGALDQRTILALEIIRTEYLRNMGFNTTQKEKKKMNLEKYFTETKGIGVMATSEESGVVDTAIYSRPHVQGKNEIAFVMRDRLTHQNLQTNTHANYLFLEEGQGYNGVRIFLTKLDESTDQDLIASITRRHLSSEDERLRGEKFLVRFKVDKILTLIGGEEIAIE